MTNFIKEMRGLVLKSRPVYFELMNHIYGIWPTAQLTDFVLPLFSLHANNSTCSLIRQMIFQCVTFRSILNAGMFSLNCTCENQK